MAVVAFKPRPKPGDFAPVAKPQFRELPLDLQEALLKLADLMAIDAANKFVNGGGE